MIVAIKWGIITLMAIIFWIALAQIGPVETFTPGWGWGLLAWCVSVIAGQILITTFKGNENDRHSHT